MVSAILARAGGIDAGDLVDEVVAAPAAEVLPLQEHLGGVHDHRAPHCGELSLAHRELGSAERILPADVIPVVDVERERNHLVGPEAPGKQRGQPVIGRRAGIAALRRIQLHQCRRVRPAVGGARRVGGAGGARKRDRAQRQYGPCLHDSSVAPLAFFLTFRRDANPVDCGLRPSWSRAVKDIYKWMGIVFAIGVALMFLEYRFAKKKKEGYTAIDRQRILGIFWLTVFFSLLVGGVMWMSD
jgi:hypothetical protein